MQKKAVTDLNVPDGSRDIPFQCQKMSKMDIAILHPHFYLTSQMQCCKTMKKMKVSYLKCLLFDLFETLQAVRT